MGRPSKATEWLTEENLELIRSWKRKGITNEAIAVNKIHISECTIYEWAKKYPKFAEALKTEPDIAICETENALYKTAKGYFVEEETIEQWDDGLGHVRKHVVRRKRWIEGKIAAQIFILKNRDNKHWQDNPLPAEDMENLKRAKVLLDGVDSAID